MEVIYSKREVYIHEKPKDTSGLAKDVNKIGGIIQIVKNVV
jgi:hypothetical protein